MTGIPDKYFKSTVSKCLAKTTNSVSGVVVILASWAILLSGSSNGLLLDNKYSRMSLSLNNPSRFPPSSISIQHANRCVVKYTRASLNVEFRVSL